MPGHDAHGHAHEPGAHGYDAHRYDVHRHHHGGGGHVHAPASFGAAFAIGIALNGGYVLAEGFYGLTAHSLALLADAGHNFGDVLGLFAAWGASMLGRRKPGGKYTYGLRRTSVLAALGNAVVLLVVTGGIAWEAVLRLASPRAGRRRHHRDRGGDRDCGERHHCLAVHVGPQG